MNVDYIKLGAICELLRGWLPSYELRVMFELESVKIMVIGEKEYNFTLTLDYLKSHDVNEISEYIYDRIAINVK